MKKSLDSAHKSSWEIAEVVFGIPFMASIVLHFIVPLSLPPGIFRQALVVVGIVLIMIGFGLVVITRRELARYGQPTDPGHPTSQVVKTSAFAITRNPLYLASIIILLGISLAFNILWALVPLVVSTIICHYVLIVPEENYLMAKFGEEYRDYMATVHRWLGRSR
jgi:protein-S-isoprenylcysteine O-methyltransferase Ste14